MIEGKLKFEAKNDQDQIDHEPKRLSWHAQANCLDSDVNIFFPEAWGSLAEAKKICSGCEVRQECSEAGSTERYGVWGGTSRGERFEKSPAAEEGIRYIPNSKL